MSDVVIKTDGLYRSYGQTPRAIEVLKGIDLEVRRADLLIIQGPSGAGKSTLLHILGGLDKPTRGEVFIDSEDIYRLKEDRRADLRNKKIGFVFQFYYLLPEFCVLENVFLPALINGQKKKADLIKEAKRLLDLVKLSDRATHKPHELSGGEMQRAAIARALINDPEVIFCDEPTGNLDSKTGKQICELLVGLNKDSNKTLVIVTHDEDIAKISKRVLHMRDGKLHN